jgi:hypothetical protein
MKDPDITAQLPLSTTKKRTAKEAAKETTKGAAKEAAKVVALPLPCPRVDSEARTSETDQAASETRWGQQHERTPPQTPETEPLVCAVFSAAA